MNQADTFEAEMKEIWDEDPNKLFWDWHNANDRAKFHGASQTGRTNNNWSEWEFGDESKVWILEDGSGTSNVLP